MSLFSPTWFMEGFWHPLQTPSHLILLLGLAILLGPHGKQAIFRNLFVFVGSLFTGFIIHYFYAPTWNLQLLLLVSALCIGLLVILRLQLPTIVLFLLSTISGIMLGLDSNPIMIPGLGNSIMYHWLAGATVSMTLLLLVLSTLSFALRNLINGVALRVIGSWIATSAIFVLTLLLVKL